MAGPTGWIVVVTLLGIAWLVSLNQDSPQPPRAHRRPGHLAPPTPPPEHRNPLPLASDDPELERLLEEARQAIDETR